jgi:1-acyl-sn-glycerol-3-phosphate acyltransferase
VAEIKQHSTRRYRSPAVRIGKFLARWVFLKPAMKTQLKLHVYGRDKLKKINKKEAFIVAFNHASHLDAPIVMGKLPWHLARRISTASAADFWFKSSVRSLPARILMNTFPIERGETNRYKGLASQLLSDNVPIMIMPEGGRSRTGAMKDFKPGAAALSIKYNTQIVPAAVVGSFEAWSPNKKIWRKGRPAVYINFGTPILPKSKENVEQLNARLKRTITKLYDDVARKNSLPTQAQIKAKTDKK